MPWSIDRIFSSKAEKAAKDRPRKTVLPVRASTPDGYPEAKSLERETGRTGEKSNVLERVETLDKKYRRALDLLERKTFPEAANLMQEVVAQHEKTYGLRDERTLKSKYWLARALLEQGNHADAERLLRYSIRERTEILGAKHPDTLYSTYWLARAQYAQNNFVLAGNMFRELAEQLTEVLGAKHADTLSSRFWLARSLYDQKDYAAAEVLFRESIQQRTVALGAKHANTLNSKCWMAQSVFELDTAAAEDLFRESVQEREELLGAANADTINSKRWLARCLYDNKKDDEAESMLWNLMPQDEKLYGLEHKNTLGDKYMLSEVLYARGKFKVAETLLLEVRPQIENAYGAEHSRSRDIRRLLERVQTKLASASSENAGTAETIVPVEKVVSKEKTAPQKTEAQIPPERSTAPEVKADAPKMKADVPTMKEMKADVPTMKADLPTVKADMPKVKANTQVVDMDAAFASKSSRLGDFFDDKARNRKVYSDSEIAEIALLLRQINPEWSKIARTYIVLRSIDCLSLINTFIDVGLSDYWFPFSERNLPYSFHPNQRARFVAAQGLVMTRSMDLEKGEDGHHCRFGKGDYIPLEEKGILGSGGFGQVDKVLSLISFREYARKRVARGAAFAGRKREEIKQVIAEIEVLKKLKHRHVVEFVGSYTDPRYFALIMSPVAEMDLGAYLARADTTKYGELRTFFGCLATAVGFLHENNIRHKDIKPGNALVHHGNVLLTDFGLCFDYENVDASTTVGTVNGLSPRYCAPEVMMLEPRNTSSDIWSLGVVFLEMTVVLKGWTVEDLYNFLREHGSRQATVRMNPEGFNELIMKLRGIGTQSDNIPFAWIEEMLVTQGQLRPTATSLAAKIIASGRDAESVLSFCGICCSPWGEEEEDSASDISDFEASAAWEDTFTYRDGTR